jgi:hypothetical protein
MWSSVDPPQIVILNQTNALRAPHFYSGSWHSFARV